MELSFPTIVLIILFVKLSCFKYPFLKLDLKCISLLKIDWNKPIVQIHNKIRGLSPFLKNDELLQDIAICPCAWFYLNNKRVKIQKSCITEKINQSKIIDTDNKSYLYINFPKKALSLEMIQIEGKKPMLIKQFLQGNKINDTDKIT